MRSNVAARRFRAGAGSDAPGRWRHCCCRCRCSFIRRFWPESFGRCLESKRRERGAPSARIATTGTTTPDSRRAAHSAVVGWASAMLRSIESAVWHRGGVSSMSWLFINAQDKAAVRRREEALAKMDAWWEAFRGKADDLDALFHGRKEWNLPAWMNRHLQAIDERLMWEFGPNHAKGGHQLVITPESHKELRPLVQTLLERAPKIAGWSFSPYRVAEETDIARQIVEARTGTALPERFSVRASAGEMNRIDLVVESPAFPKSGKQQALHQSFVAVETMLGEETLDKWIGTIDVERSRPGRYSLPPDRLKPTVEALIGSFRDQLPPQPLHAEPPPEQGSVIKLQPEKQPDYAGKEDMLVASTMQPQILLASLNDVTFYSERFSRHGERFAYLKIDGSEGAGKF